MGLGALTTLRPGSRAGDLDRVGESPYVVDSSERADVVGDDLGERTTIERCDRCGTGQRFGCDQPERFLPARRDHRDRRTGRERCEIVEVEMAEVAARGTMCKPGSDGGGEVVAVVDRPGDPQTEAGLFGGIKSEVESLLGNDATAPHGVLPAVSDSPPVELHAVVHDLVHVVTPLRCVRVRHRCHVAAGELPRPALTTFGANAVSALEPRRGRGVQRVDDRLSVGSDDRQIVQGVVVHDVEFVESIENVEVGVVLDHETVRRHRDVRASVGRWLVAVFDERLDRVRNVSTIQFLAASGEHRDGVAESGEFASQGVGVSLEPARVRFFGREANTCDHGDPQEFVFLGPSLILHGCEIPGSRESHSSRTPASIGIFRGPTGYRSTYAHVVCDPLSPPPRRVHGEKVNVFASPDAGERLAIYLNDHRALMTGALSLADRCRSSNEGTALARDLTDHIGAVATDRDAVDDMLSELEAGVDRVKSWGALFGERLGQFKFNGQLFGYSPLSRVLELEGLLTATYSRRAMWDVLQWTTTTISDTDVARPVDRISAIDDQIVELRRHLTTAAEEALDTTKDTS